MTDCPLCRSPAGEVVWQDSRCRVVRVGADGGDFPGYCQVVWCAHVVEMTDLAPADRRHLLNVVFAVETALRTLLAPEKINLAALGNRVPHLHWHVIPRWHDDSHFPEAIWASAQRPPPQRLAPTMEMLRAAIAASLTEAEDSA
jgi:diadenosine tetraphosphate (Ap4A) HIT family hydrolase